jgi:hypothetical protein
MKSSAYSKASPLFRLKLMVTLSAIIFLCLSTGSSLSAGNLKTVKGVVTDRTTKEPLAGVAVYIAGTEYSDFTNAEGKYELFFEEEKNIKITFYLLGMQTQVVAYKNQPTLNVEMSEDKQLISDVVVTGYQKIDKRKLASSILTVKGEDLLGGEYISIDKMLQGRLAGVTVMNMSATPGAAPKIRIRGSSSITGNREPVWVVDGIILEENVNISAEELNNPDKINLIGNAISSLNPEDIERVDILKDASATAIYGIKAANGVIVVTTKKGKNHKPIVSYTTTMTVTTPPTYDKMFRMNSAERIDMSMEMQDKGLSFSKYKPNDVGYEGVLNDLWENKIDYPTFLSNVTKLKRLNTNWYGELFRPAITAQQYISLSGGNDVTNYYVSLGYTNDRSVAITEGQKRYNVMAKVESKLNSKLRVGLKVSAASSEAKHTHPSVDLYEYAYNTSRSIPIRNDDGTPYFYSAAAGYRGNLKFNILNELEHSGNKINNLNINAVLDLDWDITKWLKYNTLAGITKGQNYQETFADEASFGVTKLRLIPYGQRVPTPEEDIKYAERYSRLPFGGILQTSNNSMTSYVLRNNLSFFHRFAEKHDISGSIGQELRSTKNDGVKSTEYGYLPGRGKCFAYIDPTIWLKYSELLQGAQDVITDTRNNVVSFYGTMAYGYDDRYILNFNIRTDGSNRFGQSDAVRFLPIWSVSGRWNIVNEKFMKNVTFFDELAIRASYGIQGNVHPDQTPDLIAKLGTFDTMTQEFSSTLLKYPNNKLRWEKTYSYNVAADWSFWDNRVYGSLDLYYKNGVDQIVTKHIAPSNGAENVSINSGSIENKGWDLAISVVPIKSKNWLWSISFNTGKNYNRVTDAGNTSVKWEDYISGSLITNGQAVNSFYSYKFDKLDKQGLPTFKDINEKDEKDNYLVHSNLEMYERAFTYSGKRDPDLSGGFSTYLKYKNISFNALLSFNIGSNMRLNDLYATSGQSLPFPDQNMSSEYVGRWRKPGDENITNIPALSSSPLYIKDEDVKYRIARNYWDMYNKSDIRVVSGSFLRCRSISIRYDFLKSWVKRIKLSGASLTFDVGNVFVIKDPALKGRDPEQIGLGSRSIPPQRSYSMRLNVIF